MSSLELHREKQVAAEAVKELGEAVGRMTALMRSESADVFEICRRAFDRQTSLDMRGFKNIERGDFPKQWYDACYVLDVDDEAKKLFEEIGSFLGSYDLESQIHRLERIHHELSERARAMREKADSTRRLYTTLGAALGLTITIIIL